MTERDPVLTAWDRLTEKLNKEGHTKHEVRFEVPRTVARFGAMGYFALLWVECQDGPWRIATSTSPDSWATYDESDVEDLTQAAVYAADFVELVRRTHRILDTEATAIDAIDAAAT